MSQGTLLMNVPIATAATDAPVLLRERDQDVAILLLNRPEARNSLSEAVLIALSNALTEIAADKTVPWCLPPMVLPFAPVLILRTSPVGGAPPTAAEAISATS